MKRFKIFAIVAALTLMGCEEEPPFIDLTEEQRVLKDTSYILSNVPAAQPKNVLLEDISGVNCVNCPDAAAKAEEIKSKNNGRVIVSTMLPDKELLAEFTNPKGGFTDLTLPKVNELLNFIGRPSALPMGMINRGNFGSGITMALQLWDGPVNNELQKTTSVNVDIEKELSADGKDLFINIKATYTDEQTDQDQNISVYLVENDIVGVQKGRTGTIQDYVFQHVVRDFASNAVGDPINVNLEEGRVIERDYKLALDPTWVTNNCEIIALVHSRTDKYVYQVQNLKLK